MSGAEGEIRTREHLRDRDLNPTPLTWLGNLRTAEVFGTSWCFNGFGVSEETNGHEAIDLHV
jgi:hypothetical protein